MKRMGYLHFLGGVVPQAAAVLAVSAALGFPLSAWAAPADGGDKENPTFSLEGITVEAKRPDWESKLSPGTVTVIRPDEYKGEQKDLPDFLKMVPGVHVREVNGKGQYTTVTVRGSTAAQVGIFVDGVLSNMGGDAAVDISTIPVKNVERIEVYRGYIPSRFGGTFIGGVINIVTKKPVKPGITAEIGKASFGGKSGSLELTTPFKSGTLMAALNYEATDGDFPYDNYMGNRADLKAALKKEVGTFTPETKWPPFDTENWIKNEAEWALKNDVVSVDQIKSAGVTNTEEWLNYVRNGGLAEAIREHAIVATENQIKKEFGYNPQLYRDDLKNLTIGDIDAVTAFAKAYLGTLSENQQKAYIRRWESNPKLFWNAVKKEYTDEQNGKGKIGTFFRDNRIIESLSEKYSDSTIKDHLQWVDKVDPDNPKSNYAETKDSFDKSQQQQRQRALSYWKWLHANEKRWRQNNDHRNTNALIKWQNDNWMVKGAWTRVDRHLPDGLYGNDITPLGAWNGSQTDLFYYQFASERRQILDNKELLIQNRHHNGRLEWGWMADYLKQDKKYWPQYKFEWNQQTQMYWNWYPLREWSRYQSNRYNIQADGTYQLSDRQLLDFQMNYSKERLHIYGSLMDKILDGEDSAPSRLSQIRNRYDQKILNIQLQDTITLDKNASWFLTPAVRYNQSTIVGYSDSVRFGKAQALWGHWIHPKDSQTDGKTTWQLALKKIVNDNLTFRMTGGTYFRLLNMYEIAGDGAFILPMANESDPNWQTSLYPRPEYGKQFDFSTIWNGRLLHADADITFTYFWRNSERLLYLARAGYDFSSYFNNMKGKAQGFELSANFKWNKVSLDLEGTYTHMRVQKRPSNSITYGVDYYDVFPTFQPEWEGNVRLTWAVSPKVAVFDEVHYTSEYYTVAGRKAREDDPKGYAYPMSALTVMNAGIKVKPSENWQVTLGCNDVFNRGPKMRIWGYGGAWEEDGRTSAKSWINPEYPIQGRTWYASVRYEF